MVQENPEISAQQSTESAASLEGFFGVGVGWNQCFKADVLAS